MARRKRKHISLKTKLASALLALGHIAYEASKTMTEDQIIRHYDFDHWPILHALGGRDVPWNLRPLLRAKHREKSGKDMTAVAKVKRIVAKRARHASGKAAGKSSAPAAATRRSKRKMASRPFQRAAGNRDWKATPPRDIRTDGF